MSKEQETIKSSQADLKKQREFLDIKKKKNTKLIGRVKQASRGK